MSRQSVAKAHQKIQELSWEPQYHQPVSQYGTDYTFQKAQKKDPLKQVLRSYFPMQEEKDHRVYGAQDGAIRGNMFRQVQERWLEWQKLFLSIIPLPEISAARAMPLLFRTVPNPELHNGQAIQMIDEVRHSTIQQNLKRLYMNNYIDPAGFNSSLRNFQNDYCGTIGRQFAEGFITGDAITAASIYLTIVAETAFTNTLFVAMPAEAAANGDYLLPTVFHSVQSRRVAAHQQRLRDAADGAGGRGQPPAARARPAVRLVEQPPGGGRGDRHVHRVRHQGPAQGPRVLRRDVAPLDLRRLLPLLPGTAREVRPGHPARPDRAGLGPDLEQGLRARGRAVLRHRLARQLLADRPDDGQGLRVVRVQVPGLVRQVRRLVGELQPAL